MGFRDVVDQFHDQNGLAHTSTAEEANLTTLCIRREQIHNLNAGDQNFRFRRLIDIFRRWAMNRIRRLGLYGLAFIHRLANHVQNTAKGFRAHRHGDRRAGIDRFLTPNQTFG